MSSDPQTVAPRRYLSRLTRGTLAVVMAGGRGERLKHLTEDRCKPATPFGGKFRIIDFVLSNCVNSGIRQISVLTQYKAHSLIQHIQRGWGYLRGEFGEFVEVIPAQQQLGQMWYRGTADSLYQNLQIIKLHHPRHILVLAGDHIYKMDYEIMLRQHVDTGADVTIGCLEVPRMEATGFGVMHVDGRDRVIDFVEKPKDPPGIPDNPDFALASMGIYVFETRFLMEQLRRDAQTEGSNRDFGKDIIPYIVKNGSAWAHTGDWWQLELGASASVTIRVQAHDAAALSPGLSVWASGASPFDGGTTGTGGQVSTAGFGTPHSFNAFGPLGSPGTLWMQSGAGGNMQELLGYAISGPSFLGGTTGTGWGETIATGAHKVKNDGSSSRAWR